jgi:hypothetical protein
VRIELGVSSCVHAIGIKLLDDLLDQDQDLSRWDQILGVYLLQSSTASMAAIGAHSDVCTAFAHDYAVIWRKQLEEMRLPAHSLSSWIDYARVKSGQMMANYAEVTCLAAGVPASIRTARKFAEAIGVLFMIGDDIRDYHERSEHRGNLAHLLAIGSARSEQAVSAITAWRDRAVSAVLGDPAPAFDLSRFVERFATRLANDVMDIRCSSRSQKDAPAA